VIHLSRYLPDRRDLNRSFPGSEQGSLAARVAHIFNEQIVSRCTHGIDLHTGAIHRANLPQIRANLDDAQVEQMANAFGAPVVLNAALRAGSLRESAAQLGIPTITYEGGEALRHDETSIRAGLQGILNVMRSIGMLRAQTRRKRRVEPFVARASSWVRAPDSGLVRNALALGARVKKGQLLGRISDPYRTTTTDIPSPYAGIIIGRAQIPVMHEGDALFHIARFHDDLNEVADNIDAFEQEHSDDDYGT
jgi:predicted deacylase